jgi:hypothetical protein
VGSYIVTYSAGNCTDTTRINVDDIGRDDVDTVCQSVSVRHRGAPFGGAERARSPTRWAPDPLMGRKGPTLLYTACGPGVQHPRETGGHRVAALVRSRVSSCSSSAMPAGGKDGIVDAPQAHTPGASWNRWMNSPTRPERLCGHHRHSGWLDR